MENLTHLGWMKKGIKVVLRIVDGVLRNKSIQRKEYQKFRFYVFVEMELSSKSSISFSITGILSSNPECNKNNSKNTQEQKRKSDEEQGKPPYNHTDNKHSFRAYVQPHDRYSATPTYRDVNTIYEAEAQFLNEYRSTSPRLPSLTPYNTEPTYRSVSLPLVFRKATPSPPHIYPSTTRRSSSSPQQNEQRISTYPENEILTSQNGRFRPPPFFDTVVVLRKRLYYLGGKTFPIDEPPCDRNVHKVWRSMEKHKVNYSLQHYFYVASLSNRCFDLVEQIHQKVSRGLLEGSREKEVNQSYFNFLYGKTEDERYRLLRLLERGEISPKDVLKPRHENGSVNRGINNKNSSKCHVCKEVIDRLTVEKEDIQLKYETMKRKYENISGLLVASGSENFSKQAKAKKSKSV